MPRDVGQKEHHLAFAHLEVIGEVAAQIERGQDAMAEPVIARLERVRWEHRFLYLAPRRLILLENPE